MLVIFSNTNSFQNKILLHEVGNVITLKERAEIGKSIFPNLFITTTSIQIKNLLILNNNIDTCKIEIRTKGIVIKFIALTDTYGLLIPFYKLSLYKSAPQEYTFHKDHHFIRIVAKTKEIHNFIKNISSYKIKHLSNLSGNI